MQQMRNAARGHDLVLWYSFFDIMRSDRPEAQWEQLIAASPAGRG